MIKLNKIIINRELLEQSCSLSLLPNSLRYYSHNVTKKIQTILNVKYNRYNCEVCTFLPVP